VSLLPALATAGQESLPGIRFNLFINLQVSLLPDLSPGGQYSLPGNCDQK
jgi:hypothetical protein